jgi:L-fuculose-phosphate aldolase
MPNESELRDQICEIGRRLCVNGFAAANDGNITARLDADRVLCTPALVSKGHMAPEIMCVVDMNGEQIAGDRPITSEIQLHLTVFRARPDVGAVVHCHPPHVGAFAMTGTPLPTRLAVEVEWHVGPIPTVPFGMPGGPGLSATIEPFVKDHHAIIMGNHGAITYGDDLTWAYFRTEILEAYCRSLILSRAVGPLNQLPLDVMRAFLEKKRSAGMSDPRFDATDQELLGPKPW